MYKPYKNKCKKMDISGYIFNKELEYNKLYTPVERCDEGITVQSLDKAVKRLSDHFDFLHNQIVMIGLVDKDGDIKYEYPVLITKVHPQDENGKNVYDIVRFVSGVKCSFVLETHELQQHLWKLCTHSDVPTWVINMLDGMVFGEAENIKKEEIKIVEGDTVYYPLVKRQTNSKCEII